MADAFGADPSILLARTQSSAEPLGASFERMLRMQAQRQQMQQAGYEQQRQRSLADLVSQNAGVYQDPAAKAYALGGYGEQAAQAQQMAMARQHAILQQQQQQMAMQESAAKLQGIHRTLTASKLASAKTQEDFDKIASTLPEDYGLKPGSADWPEQVKAFRQALITPEQQAEIDAKAAALDKGRFGVVFNPVTGAGYREDKMTGKLSPVGGAPVSTDGAPRDVAAPPGSKVATYKRELLDALGKDLDPTQGKSNLPTQVQDQIRAAERLETLINAPGPFTAQRMHEATVMAATVANGGHVPAEATIESMFPKTLRGKGADFWQSVTNIPMDAGVQPFVELLRQQSERETTLGKKQIQEYLLNRLNKHPDAFKHFPEEAGRMAEGAGLKGLYDPKTLLPAKADIVRKVIKGKTYEKDAEGWHEVTGG